MVRALILASLLILASCQTTKGSFCAISQPIRVSQQAIDGLSDAEVRAILAHNRRGAALCGWKP